MASTQIDGCFTKGFVGKMEIAEESRVQVGTDHDRVEVVATLVGKRNKPKTKRGGPTRVVSAPAPVQTVDQRTLEKLAHKHCRPASLGEKFRASAAVGALRNIAREGRDADAWKRYLQALRQEKEQGKGERIERASSDWALYKALTKRRTAWGDEYMIASQAKNPVKEIEKHFQEVFHDKGQGDIHAKLRKASEGLNYDLGMREFASEEVVDAIMSGKSGKATGPDSIPAELLKAMMQRESSVDAFADYFNQLLRTGDIPTEWDRSVVTLLPKVQPLSCPKQLRPFALASHVSKAYARL